MAQQQANEGNNKKVLDKLLNKDANAPTTNDDKKSFASKILETLDDEFEEKKTAFTFYIKPSTVNGLTKLSRKLGTSRSGLIQEILETALEELKAAK